VRDLEALRTVLEALRGAPALRLRGVMGYEAQIAGLGEANPFTPLLNPVKRLLKARSAQDVAARRHAIRRLLDGAGYPRDADALLFNGGGTGSLGTTTREPWLTEVTAGSGFLQPHLFDYYDANANEPACCFALQVTRVPEPGLVTCQGGGFIASGEIGPDKAPVVWLPAGLKPLPSEGFGEVQTPLRVPAGVTLEPGDPVFCRPAKAGEIAERFDRYLLVRGAELVGHAKTYRGLGCCFH
jgi:D-serine deaminase-like pyridoxal phosphate-dependent protein